MHGDPVVEKIDDEISAPSLMIFYTYLTQICMFLSSVSNLYLFFPVMKGLKFRIMITE